MKNIGSMVESPLEKVPHIKDVALAYTEGAALDEIIAAYFKATEDLRDDEIMIKVEVVLDWIQIELPEILQEFNTKPAKEVIEKMLNGVVIPDFDEEKGNEIKVIDVVDNIMKELSD
jgi:hypothetical protein